MSRRASRWNKRDANEAPILKTLAQMGVPWFEAGPLDGWVALNGKFIPVEIKTPDGTFTEGQQRFIEEAMERGCPVCVWRTPEEAVEFVQTMRESHA